MYGDWNAKQGKTSGQAKIMTQLTPHQIEKARILKACRSAVRLKYSLKADEELYQRLPELERRIDTALGTGKELTITTAELLDDVQSK